MQDDDSDLEHELEACPSVSSEASAEAAACVKVSKINVISIKKKIKVWHLLSFAVDDHLTSLGWKKGNASVETINDKWKSYVIGFCMFQRLEH